MAISDRIEAIEQHLEEDYDVLTLAGADLTNVDKNIVNLKPTWKERLLYFMNNGTDEVWNNWDKVTGEGEEISLNNTLEAKMKIVLKGNTYQEGTPTPESPQDIHVVSGDNSIEVTGLNMVKNGDFSQGSDNWNLSPRFSIVEENGIKYAKLVVSSNAFDTLRQELNTTTGHKYYISLLSKQDAKINAMQRIFLSTAISSNYPSPFYEIPFNSEETLVSTIIEATGNNASIGIKTQYYNQTGEADLYVRNILCVDLTASYGSGNEPTKEQCDSMYQYQPYQSASYPISLGDKELCWIPNTTYRDRIFKAITGDTYYDSLDNTTKESLTYGSWYLKKEIGKVVFDGSEDERWRLNSSGTYTKYQWSTALPDKYNVINTPIYCSHFKQITVSQGDTKETIGIVNGHYSDYSIQIISDISTLADFTTWLQSNNTTVYYVLSTPTYEPITDTTLLGQLEALEKGKSYNGQTNLSQTSNDLASVMSATALEEMD